MESVSADVQAVTERVVSEHELLDRVRQELAKVIVGQEQLIERVFVALLSNNHVVSEGVPGLA